MRVFGGLFFSSALSSIAAVLRFAKGVIRVTAFERLPKFEKQLGRVEPDVREAAEAALQLEST